MNDTAEQPGVMFCSKCGANCSEGFVDEDRRLCGECAEPTMETVKRVVGDDNKKGGGKWLGSFRLEGLDGWEVDYLRERTKGYVKFENDDRAGWLVDEALRYRLLLRRNSIEYDGAPTVKARAVIEAERRKLNEVLTQLTNDLAELPRQDKGVSQYEQALTAAVSRSRLARAERLKETGGKIGQLSKEAKKLAEEGGLEDDVYEIQFDERVTIPAEVEKALEDM